MSAPKKMTPVQQLTKKQSIDGTPISKAQPTTVVAEQIKKRVPGVEDITAESLNAVLSTEETLNSFEALKEIDQPASASIFGSLAAAPSAATTDAGSISPLQLSQLNLPVAPDAPANASAPTASAGLGMSSIFGGLSLLGLAAGGGGGKSSAGIKYVQPTTEINGELINGYIENATVFQDNDRDGILDADEPFDNTDADGKFNFIGTPDGGPLVALANANTIDKSNNALVTSTFKAPLGSSVISPLSTLVQAGLTVDQIKTAFGIDDSIDLLDYNPINAALLADDPTIALQYKAASVMVSNLMDVGNSLIGGATNKTTDTSSLVISGIVKLINDPANSSAPVDLTTINNVKSVFTESLRLASGTTDSAVLQTISEKVASANDAVETAAAANAGDARAALEMIAKIELVAQTTLADGVNAAGRGTQTALNAFNLEVAILAAEVPEIPAIFDGLSFDEIVRPVAAGKENGIAEIVEKDGNKVLKFEKIAGNNGLYSHLTLATGETNNLPTVDPIVFEAGNAKLGMWVHTAQAGTKVRLQIGDSAAGGYPYDIHWVEVEASTTKAGWDYLTFDFENPASRFVVNGDTTAGYNTVIELNPGVTYDMLAVFFDLGVKKIATETYYLDELTPLSLKSDTPPAEIDYAEISPIPEGYTLVASDEFTSESTPIAPDSSVWRMETGAGGWGNNESQTYDNGLDDAYLQDGHLHIIAKSTGGTITSARLKSDLGDTLDPYGYVEVRAKLPAEMGAWPAIWLLGQGEWPNTGEIDIVEWSAKYFKDAAGNFLDKRVEAALHFYGDGNQSEDYLTSGNTQFKNGTTLADSVENFHTYQLWWTPEFIRIGVDGNINTAYLEYTKPTNATPNNWPFTNPMDIILNLAIGGTLGGEEEGDLPEGDFQYEMVVDYVRVYQSGESSGGNFTTLDFEGDASSYNLEGFAGASAAQFTDPTDSSNKVVKYTELPSANFYAGALLSTASDFTVDPIPLNAATGQTAMSARVWVPEAGKVVRMQVADSASTNKDINYVEAQATATNSGWNELIFDFANPVSRTVEARGYNAFATPLNASVVYDKLAIFIDWNNGFTYDNQPVGTPPTSSVTYYVDDVTFVGTPPPVTSDFTTLDFEGDASSYNLEGFAGASAAQFTDPTDSSNKVVKYTELPSANFYAGALLSTASDFTVDPIPLNAATGQTAMSARVWVPEAGKVVRMQVADSASTNKDINYVEAQATATNSGWNELIFDFANPVSRTVEARGYNAFATPLNASVVYDKLAIFIDWNNGFTYDNQPVGTPPTSSVTYYVDDVTFVGTPPPVISDFTTLDFEGDASSYNLEGFAGASAAQFTDPTDSSNKVVKYTELPSANFYAGALLSTASDFTVDPIPLNAATGQTAMSARVWVPEAGKVVRMQVADSASTNKDINYVEAQATATNSGWNELIFDFANPVSRTVEARGYNAFATPLNASVVYDKLAIFIDWNNGFTYDNQPVGTPPTSSVTYYVDDVTFVGTPPPVISDFTTLDFEGDASSYNLEGFAGASAAQFTDPTDSSNKVVKYTELPSANFYAGALLSTASDFTVDPIPLNAATGQTAMSARVWVPEAGKVVRMQVADSASTNKDINYVEAQATATNSGWNELIFDFANPVSRTVEARGYNAFATPLNASVVYDKLAIFIDWNNGFTYDNQPVGTPPTSSVTYYVDDVTFVGTPPPVISDFTTLDFEGDASSYNLEGFAGASAAQFTDPTDSSNKVVKYTELPSANFYAGALLSTASDFTVDPIPLNAATGQTAMSARVWVPEAGKVVRMQVADSASTNKDINYVEAQATATNSGWNELIFDFANPVSRTVEARGYNAFATPLNASVVYDKLAIFIDWNNGFTYDNQPVGTPPTSSVTYYVDDVTFVGTPPPVISDFTTLDFEGDASSYNLEGFAGASAAQFTDPTDSSNKVVKYTELPSANFYAGALLSTASDFTVDPIPLNAATGQTAMSARVWVPEAGKVVRMQVADSASTNKDINYVEAQATATNSGWNELIFDFANPVSRTVEARGYNAFATPLNASVVYDKLAIFIDWNNGFTYDNQPVGTPPTSSVTYYVDDVTFITNSQFIV